jgi:hypothetical protein
VRLAVSAALAHARGRVDIGVSIDGDPARVAADLYMGALFPDGHTVAFLSPAGEFSSRAALGAPAEFVPTQPVAPGAALERPLVARITVPTGLPPGPYTMFAALVRSGAFADGRIDPGDVLAIDVRVVTVAPSAQ